MIKTDTNRLNTLFLGMIAISMFTYSSTNMILTNGFGIDQAAPVSKLDVNGNMTVGSTYSGSKAAPSGGAIIEGDTGIGVDTPTTKLDVEGDLALRESTVNIGTDGGDNTFDDLSLNTTHSFIRITGPDDKQEITGITGGVEGRILYIYNSTGFEMKFKHDDALSSAANRLYNYGEADMKLDKNGVATFIYSAADSRWILCQTHS